MKKNNSIFLRAYNTLCSHPRIVTAAFFAVILFCGLFFAKDYGIGWDDTNEQEILNSNIKAYARLFYGEDSGKYAYFSEVTDIGESIERDHGTAAYYPFSALLCLINGRPDAPFRELYIFKHMYTFLIFAGGLFCMYLTVKRLTGRRLAAYFSAALLFFSPRFFAESTFNTKDIVLAALVLMTIWFGIRLTDTGKHRFAVGFAVCCAFAANTRIIGFWLAALTGVLYIATMCAKKSFRSYLPAVATSVLVFCFVYYIITPAAWENPVAQIKYTLDSSADFSRWSNRVLYMGELYSPVGNPLPRHYIPVMLALTMPPVTVLLMLWGVAASVRGIIRRGENAKHYAYVLTFMLLPLVFYFVKGSNVYNSWRHFYFIAGPLMILAGEGIRILLSMKKDVFRRIAAGVVSAQLVASGLVIALNHPYEYGYYNLIAGKNVHERYELDYWNVSAMNAMITLVDKCWDGETLYIQSNDYNSNDGLVKGYEMLPAEYREKLKFSDITRKGDGTYYLVNCMYNRIMQLNTEKNLGYNIEPYIDYDAVHDEVVSVECCGNKLMSIYKT